MQLDSKNPEFRARVLRRKAQRAFAPGTPRTLADARVATGPRRRVVRLEAKAAFLSGRFTFAQIAALVNVGVNTVAAWRKQDNWDDAKQNVEDRASQLAMVDVGVDLEQMKKRHLQHAAALQEKGRKELEVVTSESVGDAVKLIETGVKLERQAVGADALGELTGVDGLLSGEVIAIALERQRVMLIKKPEGETAP